MYNISEVAFSASQRAEIDENSEGKCDGESLRCAVVYGAGEVTVSASQRAESRQYTVGVRDFSTEQAGSRRPGSKRQITQS